MSLFSDRQSNKVKLNFPIEILRERVTQNAPTTATVLCSAWRGKHQQYAFEGIPPPFYGLSLARKKHPPQRFSSDTAVERRASASPDFGVATCCLVRALVFHFPTQCVRVAFFSLLGRQLIVSRYRSTSSATITYHLYLETLPALNPDGSLILRIILLLSHVFAFYIF